MPKVALSLKGVSAAGPGGDPRLEALDLDLEAGAGCLVLAEPRQSLTALMKIAAGLKQPTAGRVAWFGRDLAGLNQYQALGLRRKIGLVRQSSALVSNLTIGRNLALGPMYHRGVSEEAALARASGVIDRLELGPVLGLRPTMIPPWQRRLALYARELIMEPDLLLLETPGLDLGGPEYAIMMEAAAGLRERRGAALLIGGVEQRGDEDWCDRRLVIHEGRGRLERA